MYERVWTVRFSDTDMHSIVHYPRIVDGVHETSDMFMKEISWPYWRAHRGGGLPASPSSRRTSTSSGRWKMGTG